MTIRYLSYSHIDEDHPFYAVLSSIYRVTEVGSNLLVGDGDELFAVSDEDAEEYVSAGLAIIFEGLFGPELRITDKGRAYVQRVEDAIRARLVTTVPAGEYQ